MSNLHSLLQVAYCQIIRALSWTIRAPCLRVLGVRRPPGSRVISSCRVFNLDNIRPTISSARDHQVVDLQCWSIQGGSPLHTQGRLVSVYNMAMLSQNLFEQSTSQKISHTPASTRVISSTLIPAKGRDAAFELDTVVSRLLETHVCQLDVRLLRGVWSARAELAISPAIVL
jgi:hypothetical protein